MSKFIEEKIIDRVKELLTKRVNAILMEMEDTIPAIELGGGMTPEIVLVQGETKEKDRIIGMEVYTLTVSFPLSGERHGYAYAAAVHQALKEDHTLGGMVDWVVARKKYVPPKQAHCGDLWEMILTMVVTVEGMANTSRCFG
ncbi:hypothetical protein AGMMS4952_03400 [Spirochaetia bacterium]|nr:hypothetical protein AGMMS4952_03400 [Spirochaetia bacterium]